MHRPCTRNAVRAGRAARIRKTERNPEPKAKRKSPSSWAGPKHSGQSLTKAFSPHGPYHHPGSAALHLTSASHSGHTSLATAVNSDRVGGAGGGVVRVEDVEEAGEEP